MSTHKNPALCRTVQYCSAMHTVWHDAGIGQLEPGTAWLHGSCCCAGEPASAIALWHLTGRDWKLSDVDWHGPSPNLLDFMQNSVFGASIKQCLPAAQCSLKRC